MTFPKGLEKEDATSYDTQLPGMDSLMLGPKDHQGYPTDTQRALLVQEMVPVPSP